MSGEDVAPARTTYVVVDTSTEEERQMVATAEENVVLGGGRGLLDPSDRIYLAEQTQLKLQAQGKEKMERQAALQMFRSNALQVQAHKTETTMLIRSSRKPLPVLDNLKKERMVIKAKKRRTKTSGKEEKIKKSRNMSKSAAAGDKNARAQAHNKSDATSRLHPPNTVPVIALLLQDYKSSSDDEINAIF